MVQTDGPKRHVYIKFRDKERMQDVFQSIGRQVEYPHTNREKSVVRISTMEWEREEYDLPTNPGKKRG
jgi:hypothetical protein